jgi:hypothetical protein
MTASTPIMGLRYPIDTDTLAAYPAHTAIQNLANDFDQYFGAYAATWTPQIDQGATTNIAKTVNVARHRVIGKFCEFEMKVLLTGAGTAGSKITSTMPVAARNNGYIPIATGWVNDISFPKYLTRMVYIDQGAANKMIWSIPGIGATASEYNFALAANDTLYAVGFYEVA